MTLSKSIINLKLSGQCWYDIIDGVKSFHIWWRIWFDISCKMTGYIFMPKNDKQEVEDNDDALSEVTSVASSNDDNRGWTYEWSLVPSLSPEWELNICDTDIQSRYVCPKILDVGQTFTKNIFVCCCLTSSNNTRLPSSSPNQSDFHEECRSLSTERLELPQSDTAQLNQSSPRSGDNGWMDERRSRSRRVSGTSSQCCGSRVKCVILGDFERTQWLHFKEQGLFVFLSFRIQVGQGTWEWLLLSWPKRQWRTAVGGSPKATVPLLREGSSSPQQLCAWTQSLRPIPERQPWSTLREEEHRDIPARQLEERVSREVHLPLQLPAGEQFAEELANTPQLRQPGSLQIGRAPRSLTETDIHL